MDHLVQSAGHSMHTGFVSACSILIILFINTAVKNNLNEYQATFQLANEWTLYTSAFQKNSAQQQ